MKEIKLKGFVQTKGHIQILLQKQKLTPNRIVLYRILNIPYPMNVFMLWMRFAVWTSHLQKKIKQRLGEEEKK